MVTSRDAVIFALAALALLVVLVVSRWQVDTARIYSAASDRMREELAFQRIAESYE